MNNQKINVKKLIWLLVLLTLLIASVFGCGQTVAEAPKNINVGVVVYDQNDTFLSEMLAKFKDDLKAKTPEGVTFTCTVRDAANAQQTEDNAVSELLDGGCNVLCINLVDRTAPSDIIQLAKEANVPVIFFNREPVEEDLMRWDRLYYIGADAKQSGVYQGELAAEFCAAHEGVDRNRDGKIQYVVLEGQPGHQDAILRTDNAVNTMLDQGVSLDKLGYRIANWNRAQATSQVSQLIDQFGSAIELILANNDEMALGAIAAYDQKNITATDYPVFFGIDGTTPGLEAVVNGSMAGTVYNDQKGQADAMAALTIRLALGQDLSDFGLINGKYIYKDYYKITRQNVKNFTS